VGYVAIPVATIPCLPEHAFVCGMTETVSDRDRELLDLASSLHPADALVRRLAADLDPVQPLRSPARRGLSWAAASVLVLVAVGLVTGLRGDLSTRLGEAGFVISQLATLATGVAAALAALAVSLPDRNRAIALLPIPPRSSGRRRSATGASRTGSRSMRAA